MKQLCLTFDGKGGIDQGIIRFGAEHCKLKLVVPVGTDFHFPDTFIITNHSDINKREINIFPSYTYKILEDCIFEMTITQPGAFFLQLKSLEKKGPVIRFVVDPVIKINKKFISPESLRIQTNYPRCIGYVCDWVKNLEPIARLGFNMIHIPPFQEIGEFSHYEIVDQLAITSHIFPPGFPKEKRWDTFKKVISDVEEKLGLGFMIDVVPNHVSFRCKWISDHLEATYNEDTAPWLKPAMYLDDILNELTVSICKGKTKFPQILTNENMHDFQKYIFENLVKSKFRDFFVVDESQALESVRESINNPLPKDKEMLRMRARNFRSPQRMNILRTKGIVNDLKYNMGSIRIDTEIAIALYATNGIMTKDDENNFIQELKAVNAPLEKHFIELCQTIAENNTKIVSLNPRWCIQRYFTTFTAADGRTLHAAVNGWPDGNQTADLVSKDSDYYLMRTLHPWGTIVKLRYGSSKEDSPFVWNLMSEYVKSVASVSHAVRMDNAHATPLHVAEFLLGEMRSVNPNVFVMVELFTDSEEADIELTGRLGINGFLREGVFRRTPTGMAHLLRHSAQRTAGALDRFESGAVRPSRAIPAVIFDVTHDNNAPAFDRLPLMAPIAMAAAPIASTRTVDDMLAFNPSVVSETRPYPLSEGGLQPVRRLLNSIHAEASSKYPEILTEVHSDVLSILRFCSATGDGISMLIRFHPNSEKGQNERAKEIPVQYEISDVIFEAHLESWELSSEMKPGKVKMQLREGQTLFTTICHSVINVEGLPEGGVVCYRVRISDRAKSSMHELSKEKLEAMFEVALRDLSPTDLNFVLFRSGAEEREWTGEDTYAFPEYGSTPFAGVEGVLSAIEGVPMQHPLFDNIRGGDWLMDYACCRLRSLPSLGGLEQALVKAFWLVKGLPRFLIPKYLDRCLSALREAARERLFEQMSTFVAGGDSFVKDLAAATAAFYGLSRSSPLVCSDSRGRFDGIISNPEASLASNLPSGCVGRERCSGDDTFISLRGQFMITGRFGEARDHLIAYAAALKFGLIPSSLNANGEPEYRSVTATWYFLQALQDYAMTAPDDDSLFEFPVPRIFDEHGNRRQRGKCTMADVVREILQRHSEGIHYNGLDVVVDFQTGFVLSFSDWDRGRGGALVEVIGLLASTLRWLCKAFKFEGVTVGGKLIRWEEWHGLIEANFEKWFYIPRNSKHDSLFAVEQGFAGRRGVYKDSVGAPEESADMLFRPFVQIAMCAAPEIFDPVHAVRCLGLVEAVLVGRSGILDLGDEKAWLTGAFFRASMRFRRGVTERMRRLLASIKNSLRSMSEMSVMTAASILDALYDYSLFSDAELESFDDADEYEYDDD